MGLLDKKLDNDPKQLSKRIAELKAQEERYHKAKSEFLEARTIGQARKELDKREQELLGNIDHLKAEAADLKAQAKVVLEEAEKLKQAEISKRDALSIKESQLIDREKEAEKLETKLDKMQKDLIIKTTKADAEKTKYESRLAELEKGLRALVNG